MLFPPEHPGITRPGLTLALATLFAVSFGVVVQSSFSGSNRVLAILLGVALLTATALIASIRRSLRPGPESAGWKVLSLSLLIACIVQCFRLLASFGMHLPAAITNASITLSVLGIGLQVPALYAWHLAPRSRFDRTRYGLDGLLFALAIFFILWAVVLGPAFLSERFPMVERLTWLATFLIQDLLLGLGVYLGLPEPSRFRGPLGWLTAAFLIAGLHNFSWLLYALSGAPLSQYPPGPPFIFLVPLAYLGAALSSHPVGSDSPTDERLRGIHVLPYAPFLGAMVLGIWLLATGAGTGPRLVLVWLAFGMVAVLLGRQYLALRDFSTSSLTLERRVAERTKALQEAQALLLRTERMNSMASLGAGLSHDINNLLCAIRNRAELVIKDLDEGKFPNRQDLVRVQEATQHAANLSGRLMALGRQDPELPRAMDLVEELMAVLPLLQVLLPRNQSLQLEHGPGPMPFLGTRGILEQILVNLISNARDAMPSGGTIILRCRIQGPDEGAVGPLLEIEDNGHGIPPAIQERVFEPFFTTKPSGSGTGLGLLSVKSLLETMNGSIQFNSVVGLGTTFQIRLPRLP